MPHEFTYTSDEVLSGRAVRETYVGTVSVTLADGRRVIAFTRKTVEHARALMVSALTDTRYRDRIVSVLPARNQIPVLN